MALPKSTYVDQVLRMAYLRAVMAGIEEEGRQLQRARAFYDGTQGIHLTARQAEYLGDIAGDLDDQALCNISRRAIEIPLERLSVDEITSEEAAPSSLADAAREWWDFNQLCSWQYDIYRSAMRDEISCVIVGWDGVQPTFTWNELYDGKDGQVRLHFSEEDGSLLFASKRFRRLDPVTLLPTARTRLTLYFTDRIERYEDTNASPTGWRLLDSTETRESDGVPNPQPWVDVRGQPLGIAVIGFYNPSGSELTSILMPQKAMNKALADLLSAQDLHGFPMLALRGYKAQPGADGQPQALKFAPGAGIVMPSDGAAERIPGVDLAPMFDTGVMGWLQLCSIIKGWPMYLWARGDPPSGEALKVMESSLVSQVKRKQEGFEDSWLEAFEMGAKLHELYRHETLTGTIDFEWMDPETRQELANWQALQTKWDAAQIPVIQRWREAGYTDDEIAQMQAEQTALTGQQSALMSLMGQRAQALPNGNNPEIVIPPSNAGVPGSALTNGVQ